MPLRPRLLLPLALALVLGCPGDGGGFPPVLPTLTEKLDSEVMANARRQARVIEQNPADAGAHGKLGLIYEANELWDVAAKCFENAAKLDPNQPLWRYHLAVTLRQTGDYDRSLELLAETARALPNEAGPQHRLGQRLLELDRLEEAEVAFETTTRLLPNQPHGWVGLGDLEMARENWAEAARHFEKALDLDPSYVDVKYTLALAYRYLGRVEDAKRLLTSEKIGARRWIGDPLSNEMQSYAVNYTARFQAAVKLINTGKHGEAVQVLEALRKKRPRDTNILNNLSAAYQGLERFDMGEALLLEAIEIDKDEFAPYINLANCYLLMGRFEDALAQADKAVELGTKVGATHVMRARTLAALKRPFEAYQALKTSLDYDKRNPTVYMQLGEICMQMNRGDEAEAHYRTAIAQNPNLFGAYGNLFAVLMQQGKRNAASRVMNDLERVAPGHAFIAIMKRELSQ